MVFGWFDSFPLRFYLLPSVYIGLQRLFAPSAKSDFPPPACHITPFRGHKLLQSCYKLGRDIPSPAEHVAGKLPICTKKPPISYVTDGRLALKSTDQGTVEKWFTLIVAY